MEEASLAFCLEEYSRSFATYGTYSRALDRVSPPRDVRHYDAPPVQVLLLAYAPPRVEGTRTHAPRRWGGDLFL
jgi:hypothetical protein